MYFQRKITGSLPDRRVIREINDQIPDFVQKCQSDVEVLILDQDAFVPDYLDPEYAPLGEAIRPRYVVDVPDVRMGVEPHRDR